MSKASILYNFMAGPGFAPDMDRRTPNIISRGKGVVPTDSGIEFAQVPVQMGYAALANTVTGVAALRDISGNAYLYAGTGVSGTATGTLQVAPASITFTGTMSWTDVSRTAAAGGAYTHAGEWVFAMFGSTVLAADAGCILQARAGGSGKFNDVTNGPGPQKYIETVNQFVFGAPCTASSANVIRWCALGDYTSWTPNGTTQAGKAKITEGSGQITGLKRLQDYIVVYKETAMFLGRYVGPPDLWTFEQVSNNVGAPSHNSVAVVDSVHYFPDSSVTDFWRFDGTRPVRLGAPLMKWLVESRTAYPPGAGVFQRDAASYKPYTQSAVKGDRSSIYFKFRVPSWELGVTGSVVIVYNIKTQQWGYLEDNDGVLFTWFQGGYGGADDVGLAKYADNKIYTFANVPEPVNSNMPKRSGYFYTGDIGDGENKVCTTEFKPLWRAKPVGTITVVDEWKDVEQDITYTGSTATTDGSSYHVMSSAYWHRVYVSSSTAIGDASMSAIKIFLDTDGEA